MPSLFAPKQENQLQKWLSDAALINLPDETIESCCYLQETGLLTTKNKTVLRLFLEQKQNLTCYIDDSPDVTDKESRLVPYQAGEKLNSIIKRLYDAGLLASSTVANHFKMIINHHDLNSLDNALNLFIGLSNKLQFNVPLHALELLLTTKQTKEFAYALLTFEQSFDESRLHDFNDALEWGNLQNTYMQYRATMQGQIRELFDSVLHCLYQVGILHHLSTSEIEAIAKYKDLHALNIHLEQFIGVGSNLSSNVLQLLGLNVSRDTSNKTKKYPQISAVNVLHKDLHERYKQQKNSLEGRVCSIFLDGDDAPHLYDASEKLDSVLSRLHHLGISERLSLTHFDLICCYTDLYSLDFVLEQWGILSNLLTDDLLNKLLIQLVAINKEKEIKQMLVAVIFCSTNPLARAENTSKSFQLLSNLGWEYRDTYEQKDIISELIRNPFPDIYVKVIKELQPGQLSSLLTKFPKLGGDLNSFLNFLDTLSPQERFVLICSDSIYRKQLINCIDRAEVLSTVLKSLNKELHFILLGCLGEKTLNSFVNNCDDLAWIFLFLHPDARYYLHFAKNKLSSPELKYANALAFTLQQMHEKQCSETEGQDALRRLFTNNPHISFESLVIITQTLTDESYKKFAENFHEGNLYSPLNTMKDFIRFLARIDKSKWPSFIESLPGKTINMLVQNEEDLRVCMSLLHEQKNARSVVLMALGKNRLRELVTNSQACNSLLNLLSEREKASIVQALGATHINIIYMGYFSAMKHVSSHFTRHSILMNVYPEYRQIAPHLSLAQRMYSEVDEPFGYHLVSIFSHAMGLVASAAALLTGCVAFVSLTMTLTQALLVGGLIIIGGLLLLMSIGLNSERQEIEDNQPQPLFSIN